MTQKWNLQDIRPAEPRQPRRNTPPPTVIRHEETAVPIRRGVDGLERPPRPAQFQSRVQPETTDDTFEDVEITSGDPVPVYNGKKRGRTHIIIATVVFFCLGALGLLLSYLTGGATVTVYPKERTMNINAEFTAYKDERPEELTYTILTLEATGERQVAASGQEQVTTQAVGEIEISKSTEGAERLIKNTRFATAEGLIYRIEESVVVPGAVKNAAGTLVPGTIRAKVFADEAGEEYNLPAGTTLTVPGFKENGFTDLFEAITAKNPEALTGGFDGPRFKINEQELATARESLQMELRDGLLAKVEAEKPAGFTSFPGSIAITYNELPAVQYGENLVTIKEQAVLQMPLFDEEDFASFLARESIVGYDGEGVRIANVTYLTFTYSSATTSQSVIANEPSLTFKITGEPNIVWTYDEGKLKVELMDKQKTAIPQIMTGYPGIERSEVRVRPIWERSMPNDMDKIEVIEVLEAKSE